MEKIFRPINYLCHFTPITHFCKMNKLKLILTVCILLFLFELINSEVQKNTQKSTELLKTKTQVKKNLGKSGLIEHEHDPLIDSYDTHEVDEKTVGGRKIMSA
jgi:hypothetical protein